MFSSASARLLLRRLPITTTPTLQTAAAARSRISNSNSSSISQLIISNNATRVANLSARLLSTTSSSSSQQQSIANANIPPPTSLTPEAGLGAQDAMKLFIQHGVGRRKLDQIAASKNNNNNTPLVERWQTMVATYIETQCHVITLLGYTPDERGIGLYTQHLQQALSSSSPEVQEMLRVAGRDTYRMVLGYAFGLSSLMEEQREELTVVEARNIMHKVSLRMQSPEVLEKVSKICSSSIVQVDESSPEGQQLDMARKHTVIQQVMVDDVYLAGGSDSLVSEFGFGEGEEGYVKLQFQLAEHQGDPLISQYVGAAMMKLMEAAGIDLGAFQQQQQAAQGQA